jgi:ABC-type uncharacterized transport system involved in gliding motility auxiliary subunit
MMANEKTPHPLQSLLQGATYTVIVIAILVVINFLANRYNKSYDTTANKRFTLSDQTAKIAANLKQTVTIAYWDQPGRFASARDLLDRYKNLSGKIEIEYDDVDKNRSKALAAGIRTIPAIIVTSGARKQDAKTLSEEEITGAIVRAIKEGQRTVCFLTGSGEHAPEDADREGYSLAKALVEKNNYATQVLKMVTKPEIPPDCTVILVGGPKRDYMPAAVSAIKAFIEGGGKGLFLMDPPFKFGQGIDDNDALSSMLDSWGVTLRKDQVRDLGQFVQQGGPEYPAITEYAPHVIGSSMRLATIFPTPRSIAFKNTDHTAVEKLFETSDASFGTLNLAGGDLQPTAKDMKGPLTLAVAGTYNTGKENLKGQFVVVGTSAWILNGILLAEGNRDLFLNMLNWLSADEDLISIRPKEPEDRRLNINQRQISLLFYESVVAIPLLVVAMGISVWWKRR